jgi:propanediol utilization protein
VLEGPDGSVQLPHGAILARRHLHLNLADAQRLELRNGDFVSFGIDSDGRDLVFDDVIVRIDPGFRTELHLDTDEGNAAAVGPGTIATLLPERTRRA